MKGISTVIATLLMLLITIALSGLAYMYISGVFTAKTAKTIDIIDAGCRTGAASNGYYVTIKNLDTATPITIASDLTARVDGATATLVNCATIPAAGIANCDLSPAGGAAGTFHRIKIIGPANMAEEPVTC